MTTSPTRPRPLPSADAVNKPEPLRVKSSTKSGSAPSRNGTKPPKQDAKILFQTYFKSVGPRTYAAQLKQAGNGNHFLVFTEGKRDDKTGDLRKISLFLFSEDFYNFFKLMHETETFVRDHPVPKDVRQKREKFWAKQGQPGTKSSESRFCKTNPPHDASVQRANVRNEPTTAG
jgi:hypothetical protein